MAEIINIAAHSHRRRQQDDVSGAGAKILLFLGVRYERHGDAAMISRKAADPAPTTDGRGKTPPRRRRSRAS